MKKIIDAVSIVISCKDEIFVIQRQNFLTAFPGYWAFPGGKVDEGDEAHTIDHHLLTNIDPRLFGAVIREAREELGIDFRDGLGSLINSVHFLGLAVTPDFNPYRYATHFFRIDLKSKPDFIVDENEAQLAKWVRCKELLSEFNKGQILAVPPVIKVIEGLGLNPHAKTIEDLNFTYDHEENVPYIESIKGLPQLMPLSHTLPPATRTNSFIIGGVLLDPSPINEDEYVKFKNTASKFMVDRILLTHHHPDHYERSNKLARELNLPILLSRDTYERINKAQPDYFKGITTSLLKDGDIVTTWLGHEVLVMEVPGHDEGQIALYPKDLSWFIAGDLFQGIGTVVIGGEEGDMGKYFQTLEKIIKLSPKVVFPSHGIGLGGTNILQKTLEHRKMREKQILAFHQEGNKPEEMLLKIYKDVSQELWPYALENINKHLQKLRAEKII